MEDKKTKLHRLTFINKSTNVNPEYADDGSSGFDLRACITADNGGDYDIIARDYILTLKPLERVLIHTGLYFNIPKGTEIQVRPRSGLSLKQGLTLINCIGTIDESYTGECCILMVNLSNEDRVITNGDRIAQAVLMPVYNGIDVDLEEVKEFTKKTQRGDGGMGHTGLK